MDFIDILNNPEYHSMVDAIEDTISSLESYPEGDETLKWILDQQIEELAKVSGYTYKYEL